MEGQVPQKAAKLAVQGEVKERRDDASMGYL